MTASDPAKDAEKYAPMPTLGWDRAYRSGDIVRWRQGERYAEAVEELLRDEIDGLPEGDLSRIRRQQAFLAAVADKILVCAALLVLVFGAITDKLARECLGSVAWLKASLKTVGVRMTCGAIRLRAADTAWAVRGNDNMTADSEWKERAETRMAADRASSSRRGP